MPDAGLTDDRTRGHSDEGCPGGRPSVGPMVKTIATVFGIGRSPVAPGTLGSAVGLAISAILAVDPLYQTAGCVVAIALALWSAGPTARAMKQSDPSSIVIDEVAGMMVAAALLPVTWRTYLLAFALFRLLDILKPPPLKQIQRLPGSWGIVLDDLLAGFMTQAVLRVALSIFQVKA